MDAKNLMIGALEDLVDDDLKAFKWHLSSGIRPDIEPIPKGRLQKADRHDVVDCMVQKYSDEAGKVAIIALQKINQNDLAKRLDLKLQKVQQPEQEDTRNASVSVEEQPIQSDWDRPYLLPSSQEFKMKILKENRNEVYIPKDASQRKRLALIITNIEFQYISDRDGALRDEENMVWLLTALGFRVEKHRNLSGEQMRREVGNFSKRYEHRDSDSTFVVLMSHGKRIDNKDAILGVNYHRDRNPSDYFFVDDIFTHLNSVNCPALIDKPKVILIQACRGKNKGGVEIQSDAIVHMEKDFVSFKSTLPDIVAYRNTLNGSYFICYILDVFCKWAHIDEIMELFRKVTSRMATDPRFRDEAKLMPCIDRTSLPKKFYLFPGL